MSDLILVWFLVLLLLYNLIKNVDYTGVILLYKSPKCNLQSRKKKKTSINTCWMEFKWITPSFILSPGVLYQKFWFFPKDLGSGVGFCLNNRPSLPALRMFCCPSLPLLLLTILFSTFLLSLLGFMSLRTLPNVCPTGTPDTLHGPALSFLLTFPPATLPMWMIQSSICLWYHCQQAWLAKTLQFQPVMLIYNKKYVFGPYPHFWQGAPGSLVPKSYPTLETPWTVPLQAPLSMEFSRQEYWSESPFPSPGDLSYPRIKPRSPALQADSLPIELWGKH